MGRTRGRGVRSLTLSKEVDLPELRFTVLTGQSLPGRGPAEYEEGKAGKPTSGKQGMASRNKPMLEFPQNEGKERDNTHTQLSLRISFTALKGSPVRFCHGY